MEGSTKYEFIILGASAYTGKYVIREALKFLNVPSSPLKTFALAGRNPTRLAKALEWAAGDNPLLKIPLLIADTSDSSSIRRLCQQTTLILNCVGPFRLHGDPVVAACVESGSIQTSRRYGWGPVRQKAVVYGVSPWQQNYKGTTLKDIPDIVAHKFHNNWLRGALLLGPLVGVYCYVQNYQAKEKLEHRY